MSKKKLKIRKVLFGIRYKFSIIIILAVVFVSVLIGFALINQHEEKTRDSLLRQGTTILNGIADQAQLFLHHKHVLSAPFQTPISPALANSIRKEQADAIKKMSEYFASVVGKDIDKANKRDRLLDIAFIIDINWHGPGVDWKRSDQSKYFYFNRITGTPFIQKGGINDPLLEPTVFSHYMSMVDIQPYIGFANIADVQEQFKYLFEGKPDYIIIGIPLFNEKTDLYERYTQFKQGSIAKNALQDQLHGSDKPSNDPFERITITQNSLQQYLRIKSELPREFLGRILKNGLNIDYSAELKNEKHIGILINYLLSRSSIARLKPSQIQELTNTFKLFIHERIINDRISSENIQNAWITANKKLGLAVQPKISSIKFHQDCYFYLVRYNIPIQSNKTIDELAAISFKKDLAGILGMFFFRQQYFPEMVQNRNNIINLMVSILLRAIFLALLFPTFIIRSIRRLADGAFAIGKGDFEKKIEIRGTDEIGRLADIFNIMTANLKKAQEMKIEKMRMERELVTAQQIQAALLPETLPQLKGMEFAAYYSAQTESGGDYYDFIDLGEGRLGITIADVSGHGVGSGLVMAMTRTLLHTYSQKILNTKKIFEIINEYLKANTASNYFVTMFYGILNTDTLKLIYSSAGHCQPIIIRDEKIRQLPAGGIALGATLNDMFSKLTDIKEIQLQRGDYFVQYTDGIDEAMNAENQEFGLDRFMKSLTNNCNKSPEDLIKAVVKDINFFTQNIPQHDDITMIVFKIR
jgi:serine phosphatase RsbU (regulator of sigma subunit)